MDRNHPKEWVEQGSTRQKNQHILQKPIAYTRPRHQNTTVLLPLTPFWMPNHGKGSGHMVGNLTLEEFGKILPTFRFTVLRHELPLLAGRECHWDLLLEPSDTAPDGARRSSHSTPFDSDAELLTFEAPLPPDEWVNNKFGVTRLPDHRPLYLNYEGPISGDRGNVIRVQSGQIQWKVLEADLLVLLIRQTWPKTTEPIGQLTIAKSPGNTENSWELQWKIVAGLGDGELDTDITVGTDSTQK